jgi:hypothetical protein
MSRAFGSLILRCVDNYVVATNETAAVGHICTLIVERERVACEVKVSKISMELFLHFHLGALLAMQAFQLTWKWSKEEKQTANLPTQQQSQQQ